MSANRQATIGRRWGQFNPSPARRLSPSFSRRRRVCDYMRPSEEGREPMSLLDQARQFERQVRDRLRELEPLVREYDRLRKVAERLGLKDAAREQPPGGEAPLAETTSRPNATARACKPAARSASRPQSASSTARAGAPRK